MGSPDDSGYVGITGTSGYPWGPPSYDGAYDDYSEAFLRSIHRMYPRTYAAQCALLGVPALDAIDYDYFWERGELTELAMNQYTHIKGVEFLRLSVLNEASSLGDHGMLLLSEFGSREAVDDELYAEAILLMPQEVLATTREGDSRNGIIFFAQIALLHLRQRHVNALDVEEYSTADAAPHGRCVLLSSTPAPTTPGSNSRLWIPVIPYRLSADTSTVGLLPTRVQHMGVQQRPAGLS